MMKYADVVVCFSAAVAFLLTPSTAFPTSLGTRQARFTSESPVTSHTNLNMNLGVLDALRKSLYALDFYTDSYLNRTIQATPFDSYMITSIIQMTQAESNPSIHDDVINDAKQCQNLKNVLTTMDTVLSGYTTLVHAIPSYCFDTSVLLARLQSVQDNVQRLLGLPAQSETTPTDTSPRDRQYAIQKLAALEIQSDNMIKIVGYLQQCASGSIH